MARFGVTMDVVDSFFDRSEVERSHDRAARRSLSRFGAFLRRRARSSIRRRRGVSQPGRPPSAHSRDRVATIKNILFALGPDGRSLVVGPVLLNGRGSSAELGGPTIPERLEFGGRVRVREKRVGGRWVRMGRRRPRPGQPTRVVVNEYRARPFMGPAAEAEVQAGTLPKEYAAGF